MQIRSLSFFFLLLLISCTTEDICDQSNQSELVARFKTINSGVIKDTIISGVTVFGIRDGKSDSLLYNSSAISRFLLPLDSQHEFSRFVFHINDMTDTLRIIHSTEFYLISYACGFAALFTIDTVYFSNPMIKKHEIINAVIDTELEQNEEHLWIYF